MQGEVRDSLVCWDVLFICS